MSPQSLNIAMVIAEIGRAILSRQLMLRQSLHFLLNIYASTKQKIYNCSQATPRHLNNPTIAPTIHHTHTANVWVVEVNA